MICNQQHQVQVLGVPGEKEYIQKVDFKVFSNTDQNEVILKIIQDVSSNQDIIPRERLSVFSSFQPTNGYMAFPSSGLISIASGSAIHGEVEGYFKLKTQTTYEDFAGEYSGELQFLVLCLPN
jgi:hypothetical protein